MNVLTRTGVGTMKLETKFLRLRTPVTLGSLFGEWQVCWLGGWTRDELSYLVMAVRVGFDATEPKPGPETQTAGVRERRRRRRLLESADKSSAQR
jgi:hypothetical protein